MFDVFYTGAKPELFPHERHAENIQDAAKISRTKFFWYLNGDNDYSDFDFYWLPDKWEEHHLHIFNDYWCRNSETYFVNKYNVNTTELNYNNKQTIRRRPTQDLWTVPNTVNANKIRFDWHPDPMADPYIYHFPTKYQRSSGVTYTVPGATQDKFVRPFQIKCLEDENNWSIPNDVEIESVDLSWRPDALDAPFIYHFPTKFQRASGVTYTVPGATEIKYVDAFVVKHTLNTSNWVIPKDVENPDLTWRPNPLDPPYIYKFPSHWARESGLEYHVPDATESKFVDDISVSFDAAALPRYYIETTVEDLIEEHNDEVFWALNKEMDYDNFDFSWHPDRSQRDYLHVFGSQWQKHAQTFYCDTTSLSTESMEYNFVGSQTVKANSSSDIFFIDKFNSGSDERYKELCEKYENITRLRFVKNIFDTIKRASQKATRPNRYFWVISSENDYTDFNFDWHCEPWQSYMLHVFGSEHQKWSDTYLINKTTFEDHARWCKDITEVPDLNFVKDQKVKAINVNDIYELDFGQHNKLKTVQHNKLKTVQHNKLKTTRFVDSYLSVIKRIVSQATSEYIWVISNICDYSKFDFDWRPEPYQAKMLHVFGPGNNKFGDTFLVHVPTFKEQSDKLELLDWYETVNYCDEQIVPRLEYDQVPYTGDNLTATIKAHRFNSPYALFFPEGQDVSTIDYNPSVWRLEDRAIHSFTESASVVLAPRDTLQYLDTQCYDYPVIKRQKTQFLDENPLDIVYISNGEPTAERLYEHLLDVTKSDTSLTVKRVDGVNGRAAAYKAAAKLSDTDWFFTVFAKLEVDRDFDWHWQPDRLQEPKHYIFHALNPVNGLEYGHQGMIAYNKKLVLATNKWGLDFTLSKPHEVVPILSGVAHYNEDPLVTWRTAFREMIKLLATQTPESEERIAAWTTESTARYSAISIKGARDAVDYFNKVGGDHDSLLLSFEWDWLNDYFNQVT
jgi:hypothetical protein